MNIVAILPAKGASQRVQNKNMRLLDGKPLFLHLLETLCNCSWIDTVVLDTESPDIARAASETRARVIWRDPAKATNSTDGHELLYNCSLQVPADIYVHAIGTSPFISENTIRLAVDAAQSEEYDSAVLVKCEKQYLWSGGSPAYGIDRIPNSADLPDTITETMGLYVIEAAVLHETRRRIGRRPCMVKASPLEGIDVNWPEDFELAELIAAGRRERERRVLLSIRQHLTSSMLSDLLDDHGFPLQVIKGLSPTNAAVKIIGRANTLKLRKLKSGEDFRGIYRTLNTYNAVVPNDIIVVENEMPGFAYFGELNASLAVRAGASGVIVAGMTRDSAEVGRLGLPVFARGTTCQDVRKRATFESSGKTISVEGVSVSPGQLVFADSEGVVVIPRQIEGEIFAKIFEAIARERSIMADIVAGVSASDIAQIHGDF